MTQCTNNSFCTQSRCYYCLPEPKRWRWRWALLQIALVTFPIEQTVCMYAFTCDALFLGYFVNFVCHERCGSLCMFLRFLIVVANAFLCGSVINFPFCKWNKIRTEQKKNPMESVFQTLVLLQRKESRSLN